MTATKQARAWTPLFSVATGLGLLLVATFAVIGLAVSQARIEHSRTLDEALGHLPLLLVSVAVVAALVAVVGARR